MSRFSLVLHVILACAAIGLAGGAHAQGCMPLVCYSLNGLAVGLGVTAAARAFILLDRHL